ncbi:hypothetical protein COY62_04250 [bacterium (Candidatus Howlettbacteria) CG_4_10_14_0_8_um_filter_40_9]|nr:MAG: hypothetical protein COY62_04250 [bacterium (Candidatus Howlettbacteria) CG_4_10_14_0_8_um_filter_40_9]
MDKINSNIKVEITGKNLKVSKKHIKQLINFITFLRVLSPLYLLFNSSKSALFVLLIFGIFTDMEGLIARKYKVANTNGRVFDSFADMVGFGLNTTIIAMLNFGFAIFPYAVFFFTSVVWRELRIIKYYIRKERYIRGMPLILSLAILLTISLFIWSAEMFKIFFVLAGLSYFVPFKLFPDQLALRLSKMARYSGVDSIS